VHKFDSTLLDFDSLTKENALDNLKQAFKLAEEHMGVGSYLDPEDLANLENKVDERSVMTYLSQFPFAFLSKKVDSTKTDNLEKELEATRQKTQEEEERFREEKEYLRKLQEEKELEKDILEKEKESLKEQIALTEKEEDPELWDAHFKLVDRNKMLKEELEKLQHMKEKLQKDLLKAKKKLIGELSVTVHEGRNLRSSGILGLDSFVTLSYETQHSKTRTVSRNVNPVWNQPYAFLYNR